MPHKTAAEDWGNILGLLSQISVGADGTVWGINSANQIWRFNTSTQNWDYIPGYLSQIAVGNSNAVWGINSADYIYRFNISTQSWDNIPGFLSQIAVGGDGAVWGIDAAGDPFRYNNTTQGWDYVGGVLSHIAVGNSNAVWGLSSDGSVWRFNNATPGWDHIQGNLSRISVGTDGSVWGLSPDSHIWNFNSNSNVQNWDSEPGLLSQISVGADGTVWGLDSIGTPFHYNRYTNNWDYVPGILSQIAVGNTNAVWGLNSSDQIYKYPVSSQLASFTGGPEYISPAAYVPRNGNPCPVLSDPRNSTNMLSASFGPDTAILMNGCWGGAVYEYWWQGHQFENHVLPGAMFNVDLNQYLMPTIFGNNLIFPYTNPTQAGDVNWNGAGLISWGLWGNSPNYSGMYSFAHPLGFGGNTSDVSAPPDSNTVVSFTRLTLGTGMVPQFDGTNNVTADVSYITSDVQQNNFMAQIPSVYLRGNFDTIFTYDIGRSQFTWRPLPSPPCDSNGGGQTVDTSAYHWNGQFPTNFNTLNTFTSTCGVVIAIDDHPGDADYGYALGVYGCTPDLGGYVTRFDIYNQSCNWQDNSAESLNAINIYPEYNSADPHAAPLQAGSQAYITYIITGSSLAEIAATAQKLYTDGIR